VHPVDVTACPSGGRESVVEWRAVAVPGIQPFFSPLLRAVADGTWHRITDLGPLVADDLGLSASDRTDLLASGRTRLQSRVGWGCTYLRKAGLVDRHRGAVQITEEGSRVLREGPAHLDIEYLKRYPAFLEFVQGSGQVTGIVPELATPDAAVDPDEAMERLWRDRQQLVSVELLERIAAASPRFFEELVVKLLVAMGYGGSFAEASQVVGRSGDEGIDGIIKEDRLGLDAIYVQAKRWQAGVGRPEIQKFAGSLDSAHARKGVFITTSSFSPDARAYVDRIDKRIVLIDGPLLATLLIEHAVGVSPERTYIIPKVDADFFEEA
jgi:restriction system protein